MLAPGTLVGGWRVEHKLADGGMAEVYAAIHPIIHKRAAIKVLAARLARDAAHVERFVIEAQAVNRIRHPNIVDIFDCGRLDDGRLYLVMEWLAGMTLADRLWYGPRLELVQASSVLAQVCDALEAVHDAGVVHRDLKSENIFLVPRRGGAITVKLLDFGIAKLAGRARAHPTVSGVFVGTPGYVAPEQARGDEVDGRADLYAFGVTAYEVLSGQLPFEGEDGIALLRSQRYDGPRALLEVAGNTPPSVAEMVMRLLSPDPEARPSLVEVRAVLRGVEAEAARSRTRSSRELRWRRVSLAAGAVAVAGAVTLGVALGRRVPASVEPAPSVSASALESASASASASGSAWGAATSTSPSPPSTSMMPRDQPESLLLEHAGAPPQLALPLLPSVRTGRERSGVRHARGAPRTHVEKPATPDTLGVTRDYVLGLDGDKL